MPGWPCRRCRRAGKLLSESLNVLSLACYTAPVSLLCLTPFFLIYEVRGECSSSSSTGAGAGLPVPEVGAAALAPSTLLNFGFLKSVV